MIHIKIKTFFCVITILITVFTGTGYVYTQDNTSAIKVTEYVTDETGTLTANELNQLRSILKNFEDSTSNQLIVYIIQSLKGKPIEMVAYDIASKNGIGQKGRNNGVLLLIAMNEKQLRIEVGYGLEGALPDALCGRIINDEIKPEFRNNKYFEGISKGIEAIISATKGEYKPLKSKKNIFGCDGPMAAAFIIFGFIIIVNIIGIIRRLFGFGKVFSTSGKRGKSRWDSSGWFWGGGSSSGFGGGSFGGFSGGGGSFGGGGASGSW